MNKVAAFALRRKNSILSMLEKMFCPPQPLRFWITPAYAGKRGSGSPPRSCRRDHPRVCEEKVTGIRSQTINEGSPPRVRGKASSLKRSKGVVGITPAYAGKSAASAFGYARRRDHPRVCGEKYRPSARLLIFGGSPPRVRGKVSVRAAWRPYHGITPACAGKSRSQPRLPCTGRDHPRACGEKLSTTSTDIHPAGSPPPVRGKVPSSI